MGTSIVCARCSTLQECSSEELPKGWQQTQAGFICPRCSAIAEEGELAGDVLHEEVIYPSDFEEADDTVDEGYCEVCRGPCQGH